MAGKRPVANQAVAVGKNFPDFPPDVACPEDDPEAGIYWAPPSKPEGEPRRWSRPWFAWRNDPEYSEVR
jgi:hypothetical protein